MDESLKNYTELRKSDTKACTLYDNRAILFWKEQVNLQ